MIKFKKASIFIPIKRHFLLILAITGILWSIQFSFSTGTDKIAPSNSLTVPPTSPFEHNIFGIGFVEASSRNINIGSCSPGIVSKVLVNEGINVSKNDVLFILDQRTHIIEIQNKQNTLNVAKSALALSQVELAYHQDSLNRGQGLKSGRSISEEELKKRHFAVEKAKADIKIKENMVSQAETSLQIAEIAFEKTFVKSPIDGVVLKVRISPGEFINGNEQENDSPILLGKVDPLFVRVQIDESDIWRFDKTLKAFAFFRSNKTTKISLSFIRLEPYVHGKRNIKGTGNELVDTRIIEIIYKIDPDIDNLYVGQQLDIFIESKYSPS